MAQRRWLRAFWLLLIFSTAGYGYETLKTPRFFIHYPPDVSKETLLDLGRWAEGAYDALEKVFGYSVGTVHIEVHSKGDIPNGNASTVPYNKINYYTAGADYDSEIGFRNWAQSLMIHELTHIFENDAHRGYATVLRAIFGKPPVNPLNTSMIDPFNLVTAHTLPPMMTPFFTSPTLTTPTWFDEAAAVFHESYLGFDGRLNSNEYHTRYRENVLFGFADMSQFTSYSTVSTPYAYGAAVFYQIYETLPQKENFVGALTDIHAGRFYFFLDGGIAALMERKGVEKASDYTYLKVYEEFQAKEILRQKADLEKIATRPITRAETLQDLGASREDVKGLALSADEKTLYFSTDSDLRYDYFGSVSRDRFYAYNLEKKELSPLFQGYFTGHRIEAGSSGKTLYLYLFEKKQNRVYALPARYDLEAKTLTVIDPELTRFYDIAPSPSEEKIVGIRVDTDGRKHLEVYTFASRQIQRIASSIQGIKPFFLDEDRVAYPEFDFEARKTVFKVISLATGEFQELFEVPGKVRHPALRKGKVVFAADGSGVYNIYAYDLNSESIQILTNVQTKALFPVLTSDTLYFVLGGINGHELSAVKTADIASYYDLAQIGGERVPVNPYASKDFEPEFSDYSAFSYLSPQWWLPYVRYQRFNEYDQWNLGIFSSWNDPLDRHYLFLAAHYDLHTKSFNYLASYEFTGKEGFLAQAMALREQILSKGDGIDDFYHEALGGYGFYTFGYTLLLKAGGFFDYRRSLEENTPNQKFYGALAQAEFSTRDFFRESFRKSDGIHLGLEYRKYFDPDLNEITGKMNFSLGQIILEKAVLSFLNRAGGVFGSYVDDQQIQFYTLLGSRFFEGFENFPRDEYYGDQALLRGYTEEQAGGNYYLSGSVEYLIPIFEMVGGYQSLPFYIRGLYVNGFFDYALTSNQNFIDLKNQKVLMSAGGEIGLSTLLFYESAVDFLVGYARNLEYKSNFIYFTIKIPFGREADIKKTGIGNREFARNLKQLY